MDTKNTLANNCNTISSLKSYLRQKGSNHNHYKCYSSLSRIVSIRDEKCLYLSNGEKWNDIVDRTNFNSAANAFENYGKCFSFSQEENVAMWMLYGGINKLSGMIDFTKKGMRSILEAATVDVGWFDDDGIFHTEIALQRKDFDIYLTDVIYYKKNGSAYYINRYEEACHNLSKEVFEALVGCKKSYPWRYENECRLIVSVSKKLINLRCKVVRINLANLDLGKSFSRIYRGPNYPSNHTRNSLPSKLANTIDWSLCDEKNCINRNKNGD